MEGAGDEYREQRVRNMEKLAAAGYPPFGRFFERSGRLAEIRAAFEENQPVKAAGRLTAVRDMGKSIFADLRDGSDRLQVYIGKKDVGDEAFAAFKMLDAGDHLGVEGKLFTTRTGEATVRIERWMLLAKALRPLPEKWHGLQDTEQRYRQRYLDLLANPDARAFFDKRIEALREIRAFLCARGFAEVETPMIQAHPGGAAARPFATHYNALNMDMYLRIAPELYLKRLLVGGFDKIFEMNRNFRNEGLSKTHNPEFTMLEIYEAYTDVRGMKTLIQDLITHVAQSVLGTLEVGSEERPVSLVAPWREAAYADLVRERMGSDWFELPGATMREKAAAAGLTLDPHWDELLITHEIYEKLIEKSLRQPTFVTRFPAPLIPLAKACADDASRADVFELVIDGQEVAPAYTEQNDPLEQRKRFAAQVGDETERLDEDFVTALEHGMPPAGGMGVGIDRLMMILMGRDSIRDAILFPQLRVRG
jgi:lysyl-tRNA synthetase, class II